MTTALGSNFWPETHDLERVWLMGNVARQRSSYALRDLGRAFAKLAEQRARGIVHATDVILNSQRKQMVALAAQHAIPVIFTDRETVQIGGLMSYGGDISEAHRDAGVMVGRILHGAKPADLPVMLSTKVQLVINLKTANALGLTLPPALLIRADSVIE